MACTKDDVKSIYSKNIGTNVAHMSLTIKTTISQSSKTLRNVNTFCKYSSMKKTMLKIWEIDLNKAGLFESSFLLRDQFDPSLSYFKKS